MKKITLVLLTTCNLLLFSQTNRTSDVDASLIVPKPINFKIPTGAFVTTADYYNEFNNQNLIAPKIYGQGPTGDDIISGQFEAASTMYTANAADDFTVPANKIWAINSVSAIGKTVNIAYPTSFNVIFYKNNLTNLPGQIVRSENIVLAVGSSSPTLPLATPLLLSEGRYWISVQSVGNFSDQKWYWSTYNNNTALNAPFAWINPGGGFGTSCTSFWNTASICSPSQLKDLQFSLDGNETNPCKTITGRILSSDPTHSPRINRDGVAAVCGIQKGFPGLLGSGNYHYKSYTVQNTSASADCVNITIKNADITNQTHLMAYNGAFNPANLSQNYFGDSGTSSFNGTIESIGITIPANTTITLIVSEVVNNTTFNADYSINVISANCSTILKTVDQSLNDVNIFPNPVNTTLFVNGMTVKNAKIFDASGKLIPAKNTPNQIDVKHLNKGIYLLQLEDKDGKVYQDKFLKN